MGFFKKFFSIGSKKSRRTRQQARHEDRVDANGRMLQIPEQQEDTEATRLLRSSSAHFSVIAEAECTPVPPLPHPANSVTHTPVLTPAKSECSVRRQGTYTVKVLERRLESRTEFPNANPPMNSHEPDPLQDSPIAKHVSRRHVPITPKDQNRLQRLRQDPSVVSLLNMYDENGRISSTAFSNTPTSSNPLDELPGRQQVKRSGSTLRQLLGDSGDAAAEGDISWAERYLGEHMGSTHSLASTAPLETPKDIHFAHNPSVAKPSLPAVVLPPEFSQDISASFPFISSMEVEVSASTDREMPSMAEESRIEEPPTPKRAAEVFGFLPNRRKSVLERQRSQSGHSQYAPSLPPKDSIPPALPPVPLLKPTTPSPDVSDISIAPSPAQIQTATVTSLKLTPALNPLSRSTDTLNLLFTAQAPASLTLAERQTSSAIPQVKARTHLTGESQATTASTSSSTSTKIPRGPRPLPGNVPRMSTEAARVSKSSTDASLLKPGQTICITTSDLPTPAPTPAHRSRIPKSSYDPHTPIRAARPSKSRVASQASSAGSQGSEEKNARAAHGKKQSRKVARQEAKDKENSPPGTMPLRTIFDVRHPKLVHGEPPSPASSSELSPIAKEMMMTLRKQRMRARDEVHSRRSPPRQRNRRLSGAR